MSYLYDKLRDALGGKNFKSGVSMKGWSPNEVRGIVIMRDFILIADYVKSPKIVELNVQEVMFDLSNMNRRGSLNNLLSARQLSCLEEIYVDEGIRGYKQVIDLEAYVQSLVNGISRLRYYGYVSGFNAGELYGVYQKAFVDGVMDFTLAEKLGKFMAESVGNRLWYTKYNLRPNYYDVDRDGGKLSIYFKKCEKLIGEIEEKAHGAVEERNELIRVYESFMLDYRTADDLKMLIDFIGFTKGTDRFADSLSHILKAELLRRDGGAIKGLTEGKLVKALKLAGMGANPKVKYVLDSYKGVKLFTDGNTEGNTERCEKSLSGYYSLGKRLDTALARLLKNGGENKLFFYLAVKRSESLPEGKLVEELKHEGILLCRVNGIVDGSDVRGGDEADYKGLVRLVYSLCGYTEETYRKIKSGR